MLHELVHRVGRIAAREELTRLNDAELLGRFVNRGDPAAFEVLVRRHGPMVLGVCRRVVGRGADADDAFQATFITLVRHARVVRAGESLAGWLCRVARRVSTRAIRQRARRLRRESLAARPEAVVEDAAERADWRAHLDREVGRLPARYRDAFVLCHLEGRPHEAAARELGCPLGTLHSRLARAKRHLRERLGPAAVAGVAAGNVPAALARQTLAAALGFQGGPAAATPAAAALSHGAWNLMGLINAKCLVVAVVAAAALGSAVAVQQQPAATAGPPQVAPPFPVAKSDPTIEELKRENERLRREVAELKKRLAAVEARTDEPPTDAEVLKALPRAGRDNPHAYEEFRDDVVIVKNKILDKLHPPRDFPTVGRARLRELRWECTVYYTETTVLNVPFPVRVSKPRVYVVYIDKDTLVMPVEGK